MTYIPPRDPWIAKYEEEVYKRAQFTRNENQCRPATPNGVLMCQRPVVRSGRCILHTPKLSKPEKQALSKQDADLERTFEKDFEKSLLQYIKGVKGTNSVSFEAIQFPNIPWNQPPWRDIFLNYHVNFGMAVFCQPANFSIIDFRQEPWFTKAVFRDQAAFGGSCFRTGARFVDAVFEGDASFSGTEFAGFCNFANSRFEGWLRFLMGQVAWTNLVQGIR